MVSFWNSIENGFSSAGHFIGNVAHEGYTDFNNMAKGAEGVVKDVANKGFSTVDNAVNGVVNLGKNAEDKVSGIVTGAESVIAIPLILIAGGLAFFLLSSNGGKAIDIGGQIAMQKL